jgi:hypothetical protein
LAPLREAGKGENVAAADENLPCALSSIATCRPVDGSIAPLRELQTIPGAVNFRGGEIVI